MINPAIFANCFVAPVLKHLQAHSRAAEQLVLGTAVQESLLTYVRQIGGGPALGFFQMEPATHDDIWQNYLAFQPDRVDLLRAFMVTGTPDAEELVFNPAYAAAMCRLHYLRQPARLPPADDADAMGRYWKNLYNTPAGAGRVEEFVAGYNEHVVPLWA